MNLVTSNNKDCVAASLSMVTGKKMEDVKADLFRDLAKPFPSPWEGCPKVPDMNVVCDWAWTHCRVALMPFEYNPVCTPHEDCPPVPVWPANTRATGNPDTPEHVFARCLRFGSGLLEGLVDGVGHMCAWDQGAEVVFDPRGYRYSRNVAMDKFDFEITRFWLAVGKDSF
jgi:hypothetical protein